MTSITVAGLAKQWGITAALSGISFGARAGELVVLLGPSGCGKSTTLRLIAGLETATAGTIRFGDRDVTTLPPAQRGLSMVFQSYALFPHLTVRENVLFGLKVRRVARVERERRLARAAEILGITSLLNRKPSQLSGGQRQRVALARAIVAEASVCLMDEPLSNLDAQLRHEMRTEIRALQQRLGVTMLYVTHDQVEAMTMADKVILLRDGKIEQQGSPRHLYGEPNTTFVARFLGSPAMNLLDLSDVQVRSALASGGKLPTASAVRTVGIRPETIILCSKGVPARVNAIEYLGADCILLCDVGGARIAVRVGGAQSNVLGESVCLGWAEGDTHCFDQQGLRLGPSQIGRAS